MSHNNNEWFKSEPTRIRKNTSALRKVVLSLIFITSCLNSYGQRISLAEIMQVYVQTINADQSSISKITQSLKEDALNWGEPNISSTSGSRTVAWNYLVDGNINGILSVKLSERIGVPPLLKFSFPYKAQFDDYETDVVKIAKLVNRYTGKDGVVHNVYEDEGVVYATEYLPTSIGAFYVNGQARPLYRLTIHLKLNK